MLKKNNMAHILCLVTVFFLGCDLTEKSLDDPRLPTYSETGQNAAGCLINEVAWRKTCEFNIFYDGCEGERIDVDTVGQYTRLYLRGNLFDGESYTSDRTIYFDFLGLQYDTIPDFTNLQGRSFSIDGIEVRAGLTHHLQESSPCYNQTTELDGALYIHQAQVYDRIHENSQAVVEKGLILSGTFAFTTEMLCGKFELTYGRFDVRVLARDLRRVPE